MFADHLPGANHVDPAGVGRGREHERDEPEGDVGGPGDAWQVAQGVEDPRQREALREHLELAGLHRREREPFRLSEASEAVDDRSEHARRFQFNATTAIFIDANTVSITQEANDA